MDTREDILFGLKQLDKQIKKKIMKMYEDIDVNLSPNKIKILLYLRFHENVTNKDLEIKSSLSKSSVSEIISSMEKDGLITRENSKIDSRVKYITLTNHAVEILGTVKGEIDKLIKTLRECVSKNELEVFYNVINKMKETLEMEQNND